MHHRIAIDFRSGGDEDACVLLFSKSQQVMCSQASHLQCLNGHLQVVYGEAGEAKWRMKSNLPGT